MTRCIIHIGMHKTGSTSIQRSLNGFENDRFFYARLGREANHSLPVYSAFAAKAERHHLHRASGRDGDAVRAYVDQVWADLNRSVGAAQGRTLLISGEDIGVLSRWDLAKLHDHFRSRFDDVTIVGYVRPAAGFMASHFQQRVKNASMKSFDPAAMYRNYRTSFGKLDEVFGREKVQLWKFDPGTFPDGCVVQDFCGRLGISLSKERIVRLNESLSREAVTLLYTYGKLGEEYGSTTMAGAEGMKLGQLIGGSGRFRLAPDVVRPVLDANRSDIEWMEARLGQPLHEGLDDHQPGDVREEWDLLRPDPGLVGKLLTLLGNAVPKGVKGETPEEVALLVHALRSEHAPRSGWRRRKMASLEKAVADSRPGDAQIRLQDLIDQLHRMDPNPLSGVSRDEARVLVSNIFIYLNEKLAGTEEGVVSFAGLGRFRVTRVEAGQSGEHSARTRIVFRPAANDGGSI